MRHQSERILIEGPAGRLQAALEVPSGEPLFRAIVCHPHPQFGGTMDNKVVTTLTRACRQAGGVALRFNFRGVGQSAGAFDHGRGEVEDLMAAESWLRQHYQQLPLWLAGFSFGSHVAARGAEILAAGEQPARHLFLVAPAVHHQDFDALAPVRCPVTVVQSEDDEVVPARQVFDWAHRTPLRPDIIRVPEAGHFFHGKLGELRDIALSRMPEANSD